MIDTTNTDELALAQEPPQPTPRPLRVILTWLFESCLLLLERGLDRLDLFESWVMSRNYDRIATSFVAFALTVIGIYVVFLIGYAAWYVAFTPGGHILTGAR